MIRSARKIAMSGVLGLALLLDIGTGTLNAREAPATRVLQPITASELPPQARDVLALIRKGGPFPYKKDGVTFGNREKRLPAHPRGFYREYTVKTPGARDRGARRIVCGGNTQTTCYYTDNHYATFRTIKE